MRCSIRSEPRLTAFPTPTSCRSAAAPTECPPDHRPNGSPTTNATAAVFHSAVRATEQGRANLRTAGQCPRSCANRSNIAWRALGPAARMACTYIWFPAGDT